MPVRVGWRGLLLCAIDGTLLVTLMACGTPRPDHDHHHHQRWEIEIAYLELASVPGLDPDRAGFTTALHAARDQVSTGQTPPTHP